MKKQFIFEDDYDEEKLQRTIEISKQAFLQSEQAQSVSRLEFLIRQSRYIKKKWWLLQGLLLTAVCLLLFQMGTEYEVRRCLGLAGPLLAVLVLPELWKNRSSDAMEVECTTLYSLRAIYAARLTLFAGVDILMLSVFFSVATVLTRVTVWEMLMEFLLPFNVTCVICLFTLYSRRIRSEAMSMTLCLLWASLWLLVIENNFIYNIISAPMWIFALCASFCALACALLQGQRKWKTEVIPVWNLN